MNLQDPPLPSPLLLNVWREGEAARTDRVRPFSPTRSKVGAKSGLEFFQQAAARSLGTGQREGGGAAADIKTAAAPCSRRNPEQSQQRILAQDGDLEGVVELPPGGGQAGRLQQGNQVLGAPRFSVERIRQAGELS